MSVLVNPLTAFKEDLNIFDSGEKSQSHAGICEGTWGLF